MHGIPRIRAAKEMICPLGAIYSGSRRDMRFMRRSMGSSSQNAVILSSRTDFIYLSALGWRQDVLNIRRPASSRMQILCRGLSLRSLNGACFTFNNEVCNIEMSVKLKIFSHYL